jgi:hypothetical protein
MSVCPAKDSVHGQWWLAARLVIEILSANLLDALARTVEAFGDFPIRESLPAEPDSLAR